MIDRVSVKIVDKEKDDQVKGIREVVYIRKVGKLNRDEGRYHFGMVMHI